MRAPICSVCLRSNVVCKACNKVIKELGIDKKEVELFRKLNKLSKSIKVLKEVEIKRILSNGKVLIIVGKGQAARFIGKNGINIKKLKKFLKRSIKVVESDMDIKNFVQNMIFPIPVLGINIIYGGDEKYVIRIPKIEERNLPLHPNEIVNVCKSIFKRDFEVRLE